MHEIYNNLLTEKKDIEKTEKISKKLKIKIKLQLLQKMKIKN